jgi:putative nucleotidyltransferase with HDIG domain
MQPELSSKFSPFQIDSLVDNSTTDFDLFIELKSHFILYSGIGYKWHRDELHSLLKAGHDSLFIREEDLKRARMYSEISKLPDFDKNAAPKERINSIENVGAKFIECLYQGEITPACVEKAKYLGDSVVDCIGEDRSCIQELSGLADHDYYTYHHSIRVATYAVAIALQMGLKDEAALQQVALGGIFHDIGKKYVPLEVINKRGPLTEPEWKEMKSHPQKGFLSVSDTILGHVPREIILHHHERRNGTGYPDNLDEGSLLLEVQIATLADIFDALTSSRSYQNKRNRYEALDFIKHKLLRDEVNPEAFRALVSCLAM